MNFVIKVRNIVKKSLCIEHGESVKAFIIPNYDNYDSVINVHHVIMVIMKFNSMNSINKGLDVCDI